MVYVKDFRRLDLLDDEQIKQLCCLVHGCYRSYDLAYRCALVLEQRGAIAAGRAQAYLALVNEELAGAGCPGPGGRETFQP